MNKLLTPFLTGKIQIRAGARSSPLSKKQVEEIQGELGKIYPDIGLDPLWLETTGDKDLKTSLRTLDKTDFFTKEIDKALLSGDCRIGVHSAKDLPDPIPEGLAIVAVTRGVDNSDALVLRQGETLESLPPGAKIATSSVRREEAVRQMRSDLAFLDLRGNIGQRLAKLEKGEADGVVVAEAALIRLGLTHLNRITLPGETTPGQGQLAVLAREGDKAMRSLFSVLDTRPTALYLGLKCIKDDMKLKYLHYPVIKIVPKDMASLEVRQALQALPKASHLIFTSKTTVNLFFQALKGIGLSPSTLLGKCVIAVGKKTAECLEGQGFSPAIVPKQETAEGIIRELEKLDLAEAHFFWPHSGLSRPLLREYFELKNYSFDEIVLYDTVPNTPGAAPSPDMYEEILFTSPSTVTAYLSIFGRFPAGKTLKAIGPVTAKCLTARELACNMGKN